MITAQELNPYRYELDTERERNFHRHYYAVNEFRHAYGQPMVVTSGVRSVEDQVAIYFDKNRKRASVGLPPITPPMGSAHIVGAATDFSDPSQRIYAFAAANIELLEQLGLWLEDATYTPGWVHMQSVPPKSQKRFFIPWVVKPN